MMNSRTWTRIAALFFLCSLPLLAYQARRYSTAMTVPAGTQLTVRMIDALSSETAKVGDTFRGSLEYALVVDGKTVFPKGTDVTGRVVGAQTSGRLSDPGVLELELTSVGTGAKTTALSTETFLIKGESHTKSNVTKIGGGAALGAIIGGIAGGGRGAAIGAGVGAAAGTGVAAGTGKKNAIVESEAVLSWNTASDALVGASASSTAPAQRYENRDPASLRTFTARDRSLVRTCFEDNASNLPPGLARRDSLPPGLDRQLQKNGTLPPGLQRRVQNLPQVCEAQLPPLPSDIERVVYARRVLLLDRDYRILDTFNVDD